MNVMSPSKSRNLKDWPRKAIRPRLITAWLLLSLGLMLGLFLPGRAFSAYQDGSKNQAPVGSAAIFASSDMTAPIAAPGDDPPLSPGQMPLAAATVLTVPVSNSDGVGTTIVFDAALTADQATMEVGQINNCFLTGIGPNLYEPAGATPNHAICTLAANDAPAQAIEIGNFLIRELVRIAWDGQFLIDRPGDDFVVSEPGNVGRPEYFMVRVKPYGQPVTDFYYYPAENFQDSDLAPGGGTDGAFHTAFDLETDFGLPVGAAVEYIEIQNMRIGDTFGPGGVGALGGGEAPAPGPLETENGTIEISQFDPDLLYVWAVRPGNLATVLTVPAANSDGVGSATVFDASLAADQATMEVGLIDNCFSPDIGPNLYEPAGSNAGQAVCTLAAGSGPGQAIEIGNDAVRELVRIAWDGQFLVDKPGPDFVLSEPGDLGRPEYFMVRVKPYDQPVTDFYYYPADNFQDSDLAPGGGTAGAFHTAFDIETDFGLPAGTAVEYIEIQNLQAGDTFGPGGVGALGGGEAPAPGPLETENGVIDADQLSPDLLYVWAVQPRHLTIGAIIAGQITYEADETAVVGIEVCLEETPGAGCELTSVTDPNGEYLFVLPYVGTYTVYPVASNVEDNFAPTQRLVTTILDFITTADFYVPVPHVYSKTEEIAHRGDRVTSPENTYAAIDRALEKEASYMELDVFLGADSNQVIVSHGGTYKEDPGIIPDIPTQVYGPTSDCHNKSIELDPWSIMSQCDVGTTMKHPRFNGEQFPLLADVLSEYPAYTGWMIELKETEIPGLSDEEKAQRNQTLGQKVQELLQDNGRTDVWVTSFNDDALSGITDPAIKIMRQVKINPLNQGAVWEVDNALIREYDAINIEISMPDDTIYPLVGPTWEEYIHSKGLMLSAYKLLEQNPGDSDDAMRQEVDFFMTDILDDLLVKNGDRSPAHTPQDFYPRPNLDSGACNSVIYNQEVFDIRIFFDAYDTGSGTLLFSDDIVLPALGRVETEYGIDRIDYTLTVPVYNDQGYTGSDQTSTDAFFPPSSFGEAFKAGRARIEIVAQHKDYDNVDPKISITSDCATFHANDTIVVEEENIAVVGRTCIEPNQDITEPLTTEVELLVDFSLTPENGWGISEAAFYLNETDLIDSHSALGPALPRTIDLPPVAATRVLTPGNHTLKIEYTAQFSGSEIDSQTERSGVIEEPMTVKLKPCLESKDVVLVFDGSGSINSGEFDLMQQFGVSLVEGLTVSPTATNIAIVQYASGTATEIGLSADAAAITNTISGMNQMRGGTNTAGGINLAQSILAGGRPDAPNAMIVLTDGASNSQSATIAAADAAKQAQTTMIAVGIGTGTSNTELQGIASSPGFVFTTGDFDELIYVLQALLPAQNDPLNPNSLTNLSSDLTGLSSDRAGPDITLASPGDDFFGPGDDGTDPGDDFFGPDDNGTAPDDDRAGPEDDLVGPDFTPASQIYLPVILSPRDD